MESLQKKILKKVGKEEGKGQRTECINKIQIEIW